MVYCFLEYLQLVIERIERMKNTLFHGKTLRRLVLLLSVFVIIGLSGCGVFAKSKKPALEIDLTPYVSVTYEGLDTEAKATVAFDSDTLLTDLMYGTDSKAYFKNKDTDAESFVDSIKVSLNKDSDLSNGDELEYTIEFDVDLAKELNVVFAEMKGFTVKDLESLVDYDPFIDVTVTYSGISPFIQVEITYECSLETPLSIDFTTDKDFYTRGETVVITASYDEEEAEERSLANVTKTENEYTAESEFAYVTDPVLLYDKTEMFDYIYKDLQLYITSEMAGNLWRDLSDHIYDTTVQSGDLTVDSAYYLFTKDEDGNYVYGSVCKLVLIVRVPFSYPEDPDAGEQVNYIAVTLPDIQLDAEDKLFISYSDLTYGYQREDAVSVYDKNVKENAYDYEVTEIPVTELPAIPGLAGTAGDAAATPAAGEAEATPAA